MALIGEMQYLTIGGNTYSLPVGGGGTVTSVAVSNATNGGLSVSGSPISSSGTITIGHSNVLTAAQTTQAVYPIKIDKNGHISAYGNAVTIPTVNNATLTIQKNGTTVNSFTANASSNVTANIIVPTKTSDLINDSGYITDVQVDGTSVVTGGVAEISIPQEIFIAEYNSTSFNAVKNAYMSGQTIICHYDIDYLTGYVPLIDVILDEAPTGFVFTGFSNASLDGFPFQYIYLDRRDGWDSFLGELAIYDHIHGNITNGGDITTTATIASGDRLVINDESASKVNNSSITFGSSTSQYLANNGTWQNIPTVPTKTSDLTNDSGFINSIKTINNQSLIGSGDITVSTTAAQIIRWTESA